MVFLLVIQIRNPVMRGSRMSLAICAIRMSWSGLMFKEEKKIPNIKITIQTARNLVDFIEVFHCKQPFTTYAAAKGAVIAEVVPAVTNRKAVKMETYFPYKGSSPFARLEALSTSLLRVSHNKYPKLIKKLKINL